jgi:phosphopantothenoylcysteine synthetase/decarboxylase
LYVITCATAAAPHVDQLVRRAQADGWTVCVIATPSALRFIDVPALAAATGFPVRSDYKLPGTPDVLPPADAMIVVASFNTVNKWAHGHSDNLALGLIAEAIGLRLPLVAIPMVNAALAAHPAYGRSIAELRAAGVRFVIPEPPQVVPGKDLVPPPLPWAAALAALSPTSGPRGTGCPSDS